MIPGFRYRRLLRLLLAMAMVLTVTLPAAAKKADPPGQLVNLQLLAFNDYHGHLEPGTPGPVGATPAGGAQYLAAHLAQLRQGHKHTLTVAAGGRRALADRFCISESPKA